MVKYIHNKGTVAEYGFVTKAQNCERDKGKKGEEYAEYTMKLFCRVAAAVTRLQQKAYSATVP